MSSSWPVVPADRDDLPLDRVRWCCPLLEQLHQPLSRGPAAPRGGVQVGAERGERLQLTELREVHPQPAGDGLHRLGLRGAADPGDRDADVDRGAHAGVEQVRLRKIWPSVIEMTLVGM